jgi:hypothetical protein
MLLLLTLLPHPVWDVAGGNGGVATVLIGFLVWLLIGAALAIPVGRFIRAGNPCDESARVDARAPRGHERTTARRSGSSIARRTARLGPA